MSERSQIIYDSWSQVPERVISQGTMLWNKTGSWRYMRPVYRRLTPPCNEGCPAGSNIEGFIRQAEKKDFTGALKLIREENPFSSVCGRVCFHPCEKNCNRGHYDQPVAINAIERFISDTALKEFKPEKLFLPSDKNIAVIGAGPSGLSCAYHLARFGHHVTVFEKADKPGGILQYGIPAYRLPKDILDREIEDIKDLGVEIKCGVRLGKDILWDALDSYDAVFIGTGCHLEKILFAESEKINTVMPSLSYLTDIAKNKTGKNVAVIGGGNSAVDAARTAVRTGSKVTVYYHRTQDEMPAFEEEIKDAKKEGVQFEFLVRPIDIETKWGKLKQLKLGKTRLGEPDDSGRRRPEPVTGSEFCVKVDTVITAIGEQVDFDLLPPMLAHDDWKVTIDHFGRTTMDKVFCGGDAALDEHNIAEAIGSGKTCACAIDAFLCGLDIDAVMDQIRIGSTSKISAARYALIRQAEELPEILKDVPGFDKINTAYFYHKQRAQREKLPVQERLAGFDEVCGSLSVNGVVAESGRCFHCGVCTECDNCLKFCPDVSVIKRQDGTGYDIDLDYCKGCGICVNECPRAAMVMEADK